MMQTATVAVSASSYTDRAQRHKDGSILLSIADDRICKLNGVGALTWMVLEETPTGLTVEEVVRELSKQFAAINAEGQLRYEVSPEQLRHDTARFLKKMTEVHLLRIERSPKGEESYCISEGVSGTTSQTVADAVATRAIEPIENVTVEGDCRLLKREILAAFAGLLAFDLLLKFRGFQSLLKRVENWPITEPRINNLAPCRRVRAMVDRAQIYYPKKAMCLQRSAVITCLLRRRGLGAELVLGAQEYPPKGHAWAEVNGVVVNDNPAVNMKYRELKRV